jgi:hypothetical protein
MIGVSHQHPMRIWNLVKKKKKKRPYNTVVAGITAMKKIDKILALWSLYFTGRRAQLK